MDVLVSRSRIGNDVGRTVVAALVGGTVSAATGGKFANGAATAVLANAFGRALAREGRGSFTETPNPELGGKASAAAAAALDEQGLLNQVYSASDLRIAVDRWRGVVVPIAEKYQVEISALLTDLGDAFTIAPPHSNGMKSAVFPLEGPRSPHVGKLMGFVHTHPFSSVLSDHDIGTAWQMAQGRNAAPKVYAFAVTRESVGVWDSVDRVPQENW